MLESYFPVLLFMLLALLVGVLPVALGRILAPHRPDAEKLSAYECGFPPFADARLKFNVRYYLIAILFILFDLEIAFLFPWGAVYRDAAAAPSVAAFAAAEAGIFVLILLLGDAYAWARGALDWE
ncbi:MAG: NADH-quinone oxidoreductase subunit A [Zoogloeaceae bacterium]|jgi:NADH-quinone oxidoreductase subunit A|nr:NADH-quinone oxidoreductase subunit A [Zoogloeaceae bacterium]